MAKVRGTTILGTLEFARTRFGELKTREVVEALRPEQRSMLRDVAGSGIAAHGWYETALLADLTGRLDSRLGEGDLSLAREAGIHVAFQDVNRFFKWLMRLGGPSVLFNRAGAVWNNYYDDGRYVLESLGDGRAVDPHRGQLIGGAGDLQAHRGLDRARAGAHARAHTQPVIHEQGHLLREPAVGPQSFCRFVAEWKA